MEEPPSPKVQDQAVGLLLEMSVKLTASGAEPVVGVPLKLATGGCGDCPGRVTILKRTRSEEML